MLLLLIFTILLVAFTLWVASLIVPFFAICSVLWGAVIFLVLAEILLMATVGFSMAARDKNGAPFNLTLMGMATLYLFGSLIVVPLAMLFSGLTPLFLAHAIMWLGIIGLAFALRSQSAQQSAEREERGNQRSEIRLRARRFEQALIPLRGCVAAEPLMEQAELLVEKLRFAPESPAKVECIRLDVELDRQLDQCIEQMTKLASGEAETADALKMSMEQLLFVIDNRKLAISGNL